MGRALIVLAGAGVLVLSLIAGSFTLSGGIPGVNAMPLMDSFSLMHQGSHGHMHGDGVHQEMHQEMDCPYQDSMPGGMMHRGHSHHASNGEIDCPHADEMSDHAMNQHMLGNEHHHNQQMHDFDGDCPFARGDDTGNQRE